MSTALELSREEWARYVDTARQRAQAASLTSDQQRERERLLARLAEVAQALKQRFHIRRVVVFGSLAHAAWFEPQSDIDLAVEGAGDNYWQAWRLVEEAIRDRVVDLVDLETIGAPLRAEIERDGIELLAAQAGEAGA